MNEPIGGYFELELPSTHSLPFKNALLLNSGKAAFEYILKSQKTEHIYLPKFTCDVMLKPLKKLNIDYTFYSIDEKLELAGEISLRNGDLLVYTNYFGIKDEYCDELNKIYGNKLILDCSQAFYYDPPIPSHTFSSPRKFFGVPDGGLLYTDKKLTEKLDQDISYQRFEHLLKRIDLEPETAYKDFQNNDKNLAGEPIKVMSKLTERILRGIDFKIIKQKRLKNFAILHQALELNNKLAINNKFNCPMAYPYLSSDKDLRNRLIENKIFVPTYWPNVFEWCKEHELEYQLAEQILPLPIDQRYGEKEMGRITHLINAS